MLIRLLGFGLLQEGGFVPDELYQVDVVYNTTSCEGYTDYDMCAGGDGEKDACQGKHRHYFR